MRGKMRKSLGGDNGRQLRAKRSAINYLHNGLHAWEEEGGKMPRVKKWRPEFDQLILGYGHSRLGRQVTREDLMRGWEEERASSPPRPDPFALTNPRTEGQIDKLEEMAVNFMNQLEELNYPDDIIQDVFITGVRLLREC